MKCNYCSIILLFIILICVVSSGCSSKSPEEEVTSTVTDFLTAVNGGDYNAAFNMYQGKDFLAVASIEMMFENKGMDAGSIRYTNITSLEVVGNLAAATAECSVAIDPTAASQTKIVPVYFRIQDSEVGWVITRVSFNDPLSLENVELETIEVASTPIDVVVDNAPIITVLAFAMLGSGVYLDKKDKAKRKEASRTIDVSGATPIQKESIAQYVKFVPAQGITVGKSTSVDVWVKNFTQEPYENFAIKAKFGTSLDADKINLFFDTIAPGDTVKRTWIVTPKVPGWVSIEEPTVVFSFRATKYIGVLDPVWLQVQ